MKPKIFSGAEVFDFQSNTWQKWDILIDENGKIAEIAGWGKIEEGSNGKESAKIEKIDLTGKKISLGFVDIHVHLREPGLEEKEDIASGTRAARAGGYTHVVAMANTIPVLDNFEVVQDLSERIKQKALVNTFTNVAITEGLAGQKMVEMEKIATLPLVKGFSDDGKGVQSAEMMRQAMLRAKAAGLPIVAHCEDEREVATGGIIDEGEVAERNGLIGISHLSEANEVGRNIELAVETGARLHLCHISTAESVEHLKKFQEIQKESESSVRITAETAPHYLMLTVDEVEKNNFDPSFKMNPPLRTKNDQEALIQALNEEIIQVIATDHAPHTREEKAQDIQKVPFGAIGVQFAFPLLYEKLVKTGRVELATILRALTFHPVRVIGLADQHQIEVGCPANLTILDLNAPLQTITPEASLSKAINCPFNGEKVTAQIWGTVINGELTKREDF